MGWLDLMLLVTGLGTAQFFFTLLFFLKLRREVSLEGAPYTPSVSVIVPCREAAGSFSASVQALLAQKYEGRREFIFVVADAADPAYRRLREILPEDPGWRVQLVVSQIKPMRCAAKLANLLGALPHVAADSEALLFADSDLIVSADWMQRMISPLQDPAVGASSSAMIYLPCGGFWGFLRSVWMAAGVVYCSFMERVTGHSLALRRRDFEAWGVARVWEASLLEDMPVTTLVRRQGKRAAFVSAIMPYSSDGCDARSFFSVFNRWIVCFRVYDPQIWLLGLFVTLMKCWIVLRSTWLMTYAPALYLYGVDAVNLGLIFVILHARFPERFAVVPTRLRYFPVLAAACAPLLLAVYAVNFFNSIFCSTVVWAGRRYRIRGPQEVQIC